MGSIYRENWKRASKKNIVAAIDDHDLVRVEDLAIATGILGGGGGGSGPGDLAASGFMTADDIAQSGFVVGPNFSTNGSIPLFDGTSGKLIKNEQQLTYSAGALIIGGGLDVTDSATFRALFFIVPEMITSDGTDLVKTIHLFKSTASSGNLFSAPGDGWMVFIKDSDGVAGSAPITIDGNGKTIDGSSQISLVNNYESVTVIYSVTNGEWHVI